MPREPESFIDGREVASELRLADDQVLAIDVFEPWAAVFQFSLHADGWCRTDMTLAARVADDWEYRSGGGMRASEWDVPWSRPADGWPWGHLLSLGFCGTTVELDDETDRELIAVCGFASSAVETISVSNDTVERIIVPAPTGAYVAVGIGNGIDFLTLTPFRNGTPLSEPISFPQPL